MKGFSKRERRIIGAVYYDCERIALERYCEAALGAYGKKYTSTQMARHIADLLPLRKNQILKYGCDLPTRRYKLDMDRIARTLRKMKKHS